MVRHLERLGPKRLWTRVFVLSARWREGGGSSTGGHGVRTLFSARYQVPPLLSGFQHTADGTFEDMLCRLSSVDKMLIYSSQ